jgi:hypothetical protein
VFRFLQRKIVEGCGYKYEGFKGGLAFGCAAKVVKHYQKYENTGYSA